MIYGYKKRFYQTRLSLITSLLLGEVSHISANTQEQALQIAQEFPALNEKEALEFVESIEEKPQLMAPALPKLSKPACRGHIPHTKSSQEEILIFVSFSMPDKALKALFDEAHKYNARLIIRGLVDDSFTKSQKKIQALQINVDIDPNLFEEHQIIHVPTFVKVHKDKVLMLKGHVSLSYVYEQFAKALQGISCS